MKRVFKIFVCLVVLLNFMMLPVAAATNYADNDHYRNLKVGDNLRGKTLYFDTKYDLLSLPQNEVNFILINDYMSDEVFISFYINGNEDNNLCIDDNTGEYYVLNAREWSTSSFKFSDEEDFIITKMTNEFEMIYIEDSPFNQMNEFVGAVFVFVVCVLLVIMFK